MTATNKEISSMLRAIAQLLSLQDDSDRFRINAYIHAADSIDLLDEKVAQIYLERGIEGLDAIEGIGEGISKKIAEFLETGELKYFDTLRHKFPAVLTDLLEIPNIGPKTALKIIQKLTITKLSDLPKALNSTGGQKIFSPREHQKILAGYNFYRDKPDRMFYLAGVTLANPILDILKLAPNVTRADMVGSLRRCAETIGDIDFIAASTQPAQTINYLIRQPFVKKVLAQGDTKATIITPEDVQIDFEILPPNDYGSLLQHFTGSKTHNIHLRTIAKEKKITLSEYGLKINRRLHHYQTEKEIYQLLDMSYIPPELREDRGEIEAALAHNLPHLIKLDDIKGDLHIHSYWSDGHATIEEIAQAAKQRDYRYVGICDHSRGLGIAHGLNERDIVRRQKEIELIQPLFPDLKIFSALEVNIRPDGSLDMPSGILSETDVVIASVHTSFDQPQQKATARLLSAIKNPHVDIIGHPSGRRLGERGELNLDWPIIFKAAARHKKFLEINCAPNRLDLRDYLCQQAKDQGVLFAIGTDAHLVGQLDYMQGGINVARRGWLSTHHVINTMPLKDFQNLFV